MSKSPGAYLASFRRVTKRTCVNGDCGKEFDGYGRQLYCSAPCKRHVEYLRLKEQGYYALHDNTDQS